MVTPCGRCLPRSLLFPKAEPAVKRGWRIGRAEAEVGRMAKAELWKDEPDEHDYPAAADYLSLVLPAAKVDPAVAALRAAQSVTRQAKDLLRASRLVELPADNVHVAKDLAKVKRGERLSPVLLLRGRGDSNVPLIVADGYHRICASHHLDEDAEIPCRLVEIP
jgi:hypothetical protein